MSLLYHPTLAFVLSAFVQLSWSPDPPYFLVPSLSEPQSDRVAPFLPLPVQAPPPVQGHNAAWGFPTDRNHSLDWNQLPDWSHLPDWSILLPDWNQLPDWKQPANGFFEIVEYFKFDFMKRASSSQSLGSSDSQSPGKKRTMIMGAIDVSDDGENAPNTPPTPSSSGGGSSGSKQLFFGYNEVDDAQIVTKVINKPKPAGYRCEACCGFAPASGLVRV